MLDAIIVGGRAAGASLGMLLARRGRRVLILDRATFPSDTMSTHFFWPRTTAFLKTWGLLDRLAASGCPPITRVRWTMGDFEFVGAPSEVRGVATMYCPRRTVLDAMLVEAAREAGAEVEPVTRHQLDQVSKNHQGVALKAEAYPYSSSAEILENLGGPDRQGIVLLLDEMQDPQNLGTLLRTAEAVGVKGVFIPTHRSASVTPAVVQASAGASEHLSIAQANLVDVIGRLKLADYWVIGLENSQEASAPEAIRLDGRIALIVGSEGQGVRRLVRDSCDWIMRLPIQGEIGSLNAAVAGSGMGVNR
jgi:23S rRNA (guanosine2251-2'-O)-methyltransferase